METYCVFCEIYIVFLNVTEVNYNHHINYKSHPNFALNIVSKFNCNFIGHLLLGNCLLKHVIEGKMEGYK